MNLFRELAKKPWLTVQGQVADLHDGGTFYLPAAKLGLRVFLLVVTVLFSLLFVAYADRMRLPNWQPLPEPWLLWLNTVILILSSAAMHRARTGARHDRPNELRNGLHAGGVLAFAFLVGQLMAWRQLADLGYFAAANPANAFFYLLTALHGLHLVGGLVAWWRSARRMWRGVELVELRLSTELCAVYWHYLLLVWLVLFALLLLT